MDKEFITQQILENYLTEDTKKLAKRLGLTEVNLRKKASRLGLKKSTVSNAIVNGKKRCSCCGRMLDISHFNKDSYQPNGLDYRCKSCRKTKPQKTVKKTVSRGQKASARTGVNHNRLQTILVNGVESRECKKCGEIKALSDFYTGKGVCKVCILEAKKERLRAKKGE